MEACMLGQDTVDTELTTLNPQPEEVLENRALYWLLAGMRTLSNEH